MSTAIKVENISKAYQLGKIGTGTVSKDLERWFTTKILGKEDPFLKIGETNDRSVKGTSNIVWSLKDINFEINQGDAVGIIGQNGAGKSTLLKILSRVTSPTNGRINIKGRVASLLEVGTGFHPELSGRENIFLNGAILGMRKKEIARKLDEIIQFSGVERYVDTPVKRYSSGMYVRLAFAVAAHLESEILIVDEVLAVGDADFQKKCIGKMSEISRSDGRTILFVSHNMTAIKSLCTKGLVMHHGAIAYTGDIDQSIQVYTKMGEKQIVSGLGEITKKSDFKTDDGQFKRIELYNEKNESTTRFLFLEKIKFSIEFEASQSLQDIIFSINIEDMYGNTVLMMNPGDFYDSTNLTKGITTLHAELNTPLMPGLYYISLSAAYYVSGNSIDTNRSVCSITVIENVRDSELFYPWSTVHGNVKPDAKFTLEHP